MAGSRKWSCQARALLLVGALLWSGTGSEALEPTTSSSANTVAVSQSSNLLPGWPFLYGYNLGNLKLVPFQDAPYSYSPTQLQALLQQAFADMGAQGANAVRLWLHIDGGISPEWSKDGLVTAVSPAFLKDLAWTLNEAHDNGLAVILVLWSHDVLGVHKHNPPSHLQRAIKMLKEENATKAYIYNALLPMIAYLASTNLSTDGRGSGTSLLDSIAAWEVFNEPEGVVESGEAYKTYQYSVSTGDYKYYNPLTYDKDPARKVDYTNISFMYSNGYVAPDPSDSTYARYSGPHFVMDHDGQGLNHYLYHDVFSQFNSDYAYLSGLVSTGQLATEWIPKEDVLRFINHVAAAIHSAAPGTLVTVGAHSMPYLTDKKFRVRDYFSSKGLPAAWYNDAALIAAGGHVDGTLDFYEVHAYPDWEDHEDVYNRELLPFFQRKDFYEVDKPLLVGEFWDASGGRGEGSLTGDMWYKLFKDGYAGGLGWTYFDTMEEFGNNLTNPQRHIVPHQMQKHFRPMIARVKELMKGA